MNQMLAFLRGSRKWLVHDLSVWGSAGTFEVLLLAAEGSQQTRVVFMVANLAVQDQVVSFGDLVDHRGNKLPQTIAEPVVVVIPRSGVPCYLPARPTSCGFKIARRIDRLASSADQATVDLLILELGLP